MNSTIVLAMIAGVLLSVPAHEVSASPAIRLYAVQVTALAQGALEHG